MLAESRDQHKPNSENSLTRVASDQHAGTRDDLAWKLLTDDAKARSISREEAAQRSALAWWRRAPELSQWVWARLVNRRGIWGGYYWHKESSCVRLTTRHMDQRFPSGQAIGPLTPKHIDAHFDYSVPYPMIGLHSIYRDAQGRCWCRWVAIDVDFHDDGKGDPYANFQFVTSLYALLLTLGFQPLLFDSNGRGGYHIWVVFDQPIATHHAYAFVQWLIRDWKSRGLTKAPETYPETPRLRGQCGLWLRLPGRHHRDAQHYTRVWNGSSWLVDDAAIDAILAVRGSSARLIPTAAAPVRSMTSRPARAVGPIVPPSGNLINDILACKLRARYNASTTWDALMVDAGGECVRESDGVRYWRRPGKPDGDRTWGATTNASGDDMLHVFTDEWPPFDKGRTYDRFCARAFLSYDGDFNAMTTALMSGKVTMMGESNEETELS